MKITEIAGCPEQRAKAQATIKRLTVEEGDCLVWTGRSIGSSPVGNLLLSIRPVRRVQLALQGRDIPPGWVVIDTCRTPGCVHPDHLKVASRQQLMRRTGKEGMLSLPSKSASLKRASRQTAPKLTLQIAREIRASDEPSKVLAERHGVNVSLINRIRRGKVWAEAVQGSSVWSLAA
jgi:hypothetical protein